MVLSLFYRLYTPLAAIPSKNPLETVSNGQLVSVCMMGGGGWSNFALG